MKPHRIDLEDICAFQNLALAAFLAAKGKRHRPEVQHFFDQFELNLMRLSGDIRAGLSPYGTYGVFIIHDPKRRTIHAPCFEDRILHHGLINLAGPLLDRALVPSTFACRVGLGNLEAVKRVQSCIRRYPWFVKIDIASYFDSIDHKILLDIIARRLKGKGLLILIERLLATYCTTPGKGLPIGALTSQHFGNIYLDGLDRFLLETTGVSGHARYMDDSIWWCDNRGKAKASLEDARQWLLEERMLNIKKRGQINRSQRGVTFCGFRVLPGTLRLSPRRRRRYVIGRQNWEKAFLAGQINELELQGGYSAVHAMAVQAKSLSWRKEQLRRHPPPEV